VRHHIGICTGKVENLIYSGSRFKLSEYDACKESQRLNHFRNTGVITKKDTLFRMLRTMKGIYGKIYDYFPVSFCIPGEYKRFLRYYQSEEDQDIKSTWICKPTDLSRGRGISIFRELHELSYDTK
jgi:tubulin polyglutamylase TTLL2